jgi:SAM-dependent MidA family methyltransferase
VNLIFPGNTQKIFFSNELLDAMPVRRIGWDAIGKKWFEWGVALEKERFIWTRIPQPKIPFQEPTVPVAILNVLPHGFTTEISPVAVEWWQKAAGVLGQGKLLAIDYGLAASEFILPERSQGTLRSYSKHRHGGDLLADPGKQDITAHVNFSAIQAAGEARGLRTDRFVSQEKFLTGIVEQTSMQQNEFCQWDATRRRQLQTLTHPQHLGRSFRVLVQSHSEGVVDS